MPQVHDDFSSRLAVVENDQRRIMKELFNGEDGKTGLAAEFRSFMTAQETRNEIRERHEEISNRRYNMLIALATIASFLLGFLVYLRAGEAVHKGQLKLPTLGQIYMAHQTQDAQQPTGYAGAKGLQ